MIDLNMTVFRRSDSQISSGSNGPRSEALESLQFMCAVGILIWERIAFRQKVFGAADRNKLEPPPITELLEELETWSQIIASEPDIQKALDASYEAVLPELEP